MVFVTLLQKTTNRVYLEEYDVDTVMKGMRKEIKRGLKRVKKVSPQIPVIITPTVGIDLAEYNNNGPVDAQEQGALNEIILTTNRMLISFNKINVKMPWISIMVHHC